MTRETKIKKVIQDLKENDTAITDICLTEKEVNRVYNESI